jgi:hypothetical protein
MPGANLMPDERKEKNVRTIRTFPILRDLGVLCGFHFL